MNREIGKRLHYINILPEQEKCKNNESGVLPILIRHLYLYQHQRYPSDKLKEK